MFSQLGDSKPNMSIWPPIFWAALGILWITLGVLRSVRHGDFALGWELLGAVYVLQGGYRLIRVLRTQKEKQELKLKINGQS